MNKIIIAFIKPYDNCFPLERGREVRKFIRVQLELRRI